MSDLDRDPRIRTGSGRLVDPFNIRPEDIEPWFILRAMTHINRFTGHARWPYSIGQHTLILSHEVPVHLKRAALIHDWSEVWFNDLASPVKHRPDMVVYRKAEHECMLRVAWHMDVPEHHLAEFDEYDKRIYADERDALFMCIDERGRGDDRRRLNINPFAFRERHWASVFKELKLQYNTYFPERSV